MDDEVKAAIQEKFQRLLSIKLVKFTMKQYTL